MLGLPCTPHDYRRNTRQDHPVLSVPHEAEAAVVGAASIDLVLELIDAGHLAVSRAGLLALGAPPAGRPVDFRNLDSEELGSVYESLLELHPDYHPGEQVFRLSAAAGNERKTTGSYYTCNGSGNIWTCPSAGVTVAAANEFRVIATQ